MFGLYWWGQQRLAEVLSTTAILMLWLSTDATKLGKGGSGSIFDETLQCAFCCNLCERPVTVWLHAHWAYTSTPRVTPQAPCQHNFCLKCFQKWVGTGKKTCPTCRHSFPASFASNPRINTALTVAIRMAKLVRVGVSTLADAKRSTPPTG